MTILIDSLALDPVPQGPIEVLILPWDERCKPRQRRMTDRGTDVALALPRGTILKDGELLYNSPERTIRVQAQPEPVLVIHPSDPTQACLVAHHLGNWHRSLQVLDDKTLLAQADDPLAHWLEHMGIPYKRQACIYHPNLRGTVHD
ncbi:urease accessory protein UreE [Anthocerotibacter panamensis]|uniref:urease accessory protein UreE n=1 Tax=Anthocerotibacter panamensis TaxID=2857077 RepID=UPI001C408AC2|nr:urease accessory protein UreE [Anthocerotibacter panamensis]